MRFNCAFVEAPTTDSAALCGRRRPFNRKAQTVNMTGQEIAEQIEYNWYTGNGQLE